MEIKVLEEKKNRLVFELQGESHTLAGLLSKELQQDEHIKNAGYAVSHPLTSIPRFVVETDGADPRKTIVAAAKKIQKQVQKIRESVVKEL